MLSRIGFVILAFAVAGCGGARTGPADALTIEGALVGFPTSPRMHGEFSSTDGSFKRGFWTPVYVDVTCERKYDGPACIVVEASDCDEVPARYAVQLPQLSLGERGRFVVYAHPGGRNSGAGSISIDVVAGDPATVTQSGGTLSLLAKTAKPNVNGFAGGRVLYLALGGNFDSAPLHGLPTSSEESTRYQESRSALAVVPRAEDLPTVWFGYDAVDLAILATSQRDRGELLAKLSEDRTGRKEALAEWVRRGGRLLVSAGRNVDLLAGTPEIADMLPVTFEAPTEINVQRVAWKDGGAVGDEPLGTTTLAKMTPRADRDAAVLATARSGTNAPEVPFVVRGSYGLGRVTVVAMDVDEKPMVGWKSYEMFIPELAQRAGPMVSTTQRDPNTGNVGDGNDDTFYAQFLRTMDSFPGVPVISFGWVALFILIYIIIVGPLDYLFLKKVVKRLELTWITFPTIVLLVSVGAYYAAYALKGSDLRINKYDLVDIDVEGRRVYGQTWFSLFSPRIQNYEIGVEPASAWAVSDPSDTLVDWSGQARNARGSLFPRPYYYNGRANGLHSVPVQVWSTKGFESRWVGRFDSNRPLVVADLRHPPGGVGIIGQVTLNLPVPLENAFLLSGGEADPTVRPLGTLAPGIPKAVTASEPRAFADWVENPNRVQLRRDDIDAEASTTPGGSWDQLRWFFHDRRGGPLMQNASLRRFDQSWRISRDSVDDAILVGTLPTREGASEEITADPASPSHLWLGALPGPQAKRPSLDGRLKQETCVRIMLRVARPDTRWRHFDPTERPMIETRDLTKTYGELYALNRLTLKLERGDVYGFIGPNGAGKTTTMRILATLLNPSWGEATVCGYSIYNNAKEIRRVIGYMPDFFGVYDDMKVIEYLEFFAAAYRIKGPERKKKCEAVLELVDLGYKRDALVTSLSRGMTQRLGLARVLLHEPQVLLLDEPASGLDPRARIEMRGLLKELRKMGKTILVSSHILPEFADICNKIGIIERGKLLFDGDVQAAIRQVQQRSVYDVKLADGQQQAAEDLIKTLPDVQEVALKDDSQTLRVTLKEGITDGSFIADAVVKNGMKLSMLREEEIDLEDVFMGITKGITN